MANGFRSLRRARWSGRNTVYIGVAGGFGEHFDADVARPGNVVAVDARTGRMTVEELHGPRRV